MWNLMPCSRSSQVGCELWRIRINRCILRCSTLLVIYALLQNKNSLNSEKVGISRSLVIKNNSINRKVIAGWQNTGEYYRIERRLASASSARAWLSSRSALYVWEESVRRTAAYWKWCETTKRTETKIRRYGIIEFDSVFFSPLQGSIKSAYLTIRLLWIICISRRNKSRIWPKKFPNWTPT